MDVFGDSGTHNYVLAEVLKLWFGCVVGEETYISQVTNFEFLLSTTYGNPNSLLVITNSSINTQKMQVENQKLKISVWPNNEKIPNY